MRSPLFVVIAALLVTAFADVVAVPTLPDVTSSGALVATPLYSWIASLRKVWEALPKLTVTVLRPALTLAAKQMPSSWLCRVSLLLIATAYVFCCESLQLQLVPPPDESNDIAATIKLPAAFAVVNDRASELPEVSLPVDVDWTSDMPAACRAGGGLSSPSNQHAKRKSAAVTTSRGRVGRRTSIDEHVAKAAPQAICEPAAVRLIFSAV